MMLVEWTCQGLIQSKPLNFLLFLHTHSTSNQASKAQRDSQQQVLRVGIVPGAARIGKEKPEAAWQAATSTKPQKIQRMHVNQAGLGWLISSTIVEAAPNRNSFVKAEDMGLNVTGKNLVGFNVGQAKLHGWACPNMIELRN